MPSKVRLPEAGAAGDGVEQRGPGLGEAQTGTRSDRERPITEVRLPEIPQLDGALAWELACGGPFPVPSALQGDAVWMAAALREATKGVGLSSPNPPVGCVLVKEGQILGRGVHTRAGDPHGEIMALRDAERNDAETQGATAYVTLEPCCHTGRTPPCTDALLQAGISRVVVGVRDPNPRVDGGGFAILARHGVEVVEGVLGQACADFHAPFFKLIKTGLPWVSLKLALGSDGALGPGGVPTQVTPPEVQRLAHALRRASEALVVGQGTVAADNPQLTDRWPEPTLPHRVFHRVVLDSRGSLAPDHRIWQPVGGQPALRVVTEDVPPLRGVEDLRLPPGTGGCSLRHLLHELAARGVGRVLFEGGATVARELLDQGLVDVFHHFRSTQPAGGAPVPLKGLEAFTLRAEAAWPTGVWQVHIASCWHRS